MPPVAPQVSALRLRGLEPVAGSGLAAEDTRERESISLDGADRAQWRALTLVECEVRITDSRTIDLRGGRILDTRFPSPDVQALNASDSTWRSAEVVGGRITSFEANDALVRSLVLRDMRIGYLNLRGADVTDLVIEGCRIDTLDLSSAAVRRAALPGSSVTELIVQNAELSDFDLTRTRLTGIEGVASLRNATISRHQVLDMAELFAAGIGVQIQDDSV